jgi:hypothetical protein
MRYIVTPCTGQRGTFKANKSRHKNINKKGEIPHYDGEVENSGI